MRTKPQQAITVVARQKIAAKSPRPLLGKVENSSLGHRFENSATANLLQIQARYQDVACFSCSQAATSAEGPIWKRLSAQWENTRTATVSDAELSESISSVIQEHSQRGLFGERFEGMRRIGGFGDDGSVQVQLCPNRKSVPTGRKQTSACGCALCSPPEPEERGLAWRDYVIWPNAFPYFKEDKEHVVITTATHQGQDFSKKILGDMMAYQSFAGKDCPATLHFNGKASNSQFHLHWQASHVRTPFQAQLDSGKLNTKTLREDSQGTIDTIDQSFYNGIVVSGEPEYVGRWAERIVDKMRKDPLIRDTYTMVLLHPKEGQARLLINPRRADDVKPEIAGFGKVTLGAMSMAGINVQTQSQLAPGFNEALIQASQKSCLRENEMPWLAELQTIEDVFRPWQRSA